jgi:hypothetical protein
MACFVTLESGRFCPTETWNPAGNPGPKHPTVVRMDRTFGKSQLSRIGGSRFSKLHATGAWGKFQRTGRVDGGPFWIRCTGRR